MLKSIKTTFYLSFFVFIFWGASPFCVAQNMYKPSAFEIKSLPEWAQIMYGNNPNLYEVDSLYHEYYSTHTFEKSYHTQYYKRWRREAILFVDESGFIHYPTLTEQQQSKFGFLQKQQNKLPSSWSLTGPVQVFNNAGIPGKTQSNIYSIDQCLINPDVLYCGSEPGEVYRSIDAGSTWVNISLNESFGGGVRAVEADPINDNIVFVGSNSGIYKSIDAGVTWINTLPQTNFGVNEILVNPINNQLVLAATNKGLYKSTDGGDNWLQLFTQKTYDIKFNAADYSIVYMVKNNPTLITCEFYSSIDSGATWTLQTNGWYTSIDPARNDGGARLAVTAADPNRVYAYLIGESKANDYGYIGIYRSDDGGNSWTLPNSPAGGPYTPAHPNLAYGNPNWTYHQGFYNCAIVASDVNADEILIGGLNLWRSTNGGITFSSVAGYVGGPLNMHVDMQDFRLENGICWITTDGGIYRSTDFFNSTPEFRMFGIHSSDYWGFGSGWNEDVLVGGLYHNGNLAYHENYGNGNFLSIGGGEAATGYVNPGINRKTYFSDIGGKLLPLTITGNIASFSIGKNPNETYYTAESSEMEFHPNCYNIAYIGNENKLWRSEDGGVSYNLVHEFDSIINNQIKYIEISSVNPDVIYLNQQPSSGSVGKLWKTIDGGLTWNTLTIPSGNSRRILIALDKLNDNIIWMAYPGGTNGNKIYKSTDGGSTWVNLTTALLNGEQVQSIVSIAATDGGIYYCTNRTVYYRNNTMPDWQIDNTGLPLYFSSNIAKPFYRDGKIRIASYGKGIWESELFEQPSFPIARINVDKLSQTIICDIDSFYFEDHSFLNHNNASWQWSFQNGGPTTSNLRNPVVFFQTPGMHMVTLTVTDALGQQDSDTLIIEVDNFLAPQLVSEDFENSFVPFGWTIRNDDGAGQWSVSTNAGGFGTSNQSAIFDNYNINSQATFDELRTFINTSSNFDSTLTFDVAYAPYGGIYSDTLEVLVSTDCGLSFVSLYKKGGAALSTAPPYQNFFTPQSTEWRTDTISLSAYSGVNKLMIAFRNIGHWGNVIYIDNVNINNTSTSIPNISNANQIMVYPNPAFKGGCINLSLPNEALILTLYDLNGKLIFRERYNGNNKMEVPSNIQSGSYILNIAGAKNIWNKLLVIE